MMTYSIFIPYTLRQVIVRNQGGHMQLLLSMFLSMSKNVVPGLVCLILALPLFNGAIRQRSISAKTILVSSSNLVRHPTLLILPLPVIVKPPGPHLVN